MAENQRFLEIWLQTVKEKLPGQGETMVKKSFSTLAVFAIKQTMLYSVFGPLAWVVDDVTRFGVETLWEAGKRWWQVKEQVSALYEISSTGSGLLVAESKNPSELQNFPIRLPEYAEIPVARLRVQSQQEKRLHDQLYAARPSDSNRVMKQVLQSSGNKICPECGKAVFGLSTGELGHEFTCSRNPFRLGSGIVQRSSGDPAGKCWVCGHYLTRQGTRIFGHARNCLVNPDRMGLPSYGSSLPRAGQPPAVRLRGLGTSTFTRPGTVPVLRVGWGTPSAVLGASTGSGVVIGPQAIQSLRQGTALFPLKVARVVGNFSVGATIDIFDLEGKKIAVGTAQYSSAETARLLGHRSDEIKTIVGEDRGPGIVLAHTVRFVK